MSVEELKSQNKELQNQIKRYKSQIMDLEDELEEKSDYESIKATLKNKKNKLKKVKEENQKLEDELEDMKNKYNELKKDNQNLEYDNKLLNDDIEELQNETKYKVMLRDNNIASLEDKISSLEDEILRYKDKIAQYENGEIIKQLEEQLNIKGEVIEDLRCMLQSNTKQNKSNGVSDVESKLIIKKQNKTIQHLQDELILKDKKIKNLETPIDKTEITGKRKVYNHMEEIPNYKKDYERYFTLLNGQTNGTKYRLNITNYKKATNFNPKQDKRMKYLEDLGIEKNASQKYEMSEKQFNALIEKVILYRYNEGVHKE